MNERIKKIIEKLGLKKVDFANRLHISQPFASELCSGAKAPSDRTISDICREFGVREAWLRTGEGEMFVQDTQSEQVAAFLADLTKDDIIEFTSLIEKNSKLLLVLISDILDLSKIESNTMEFNFCNISLHQVLNEIGSAQRMNMKKGVELLLDLPGQEITISTDPTRLSQVINNLVNNAIKFTSEGNICIGYRPATSNRVKIFVEDTGTGMAKEVIEHIFDRFYKGDAFKQGTGLGLAICRTIAERFKGKIEVASTPGKGTRFTIILPLKVEE